MREKKRISRILNMSYSLPKPDHKFGYTPKLVEKIRNDLMISKDKFYDALGTNTMAISKKGEPILYLYDLERGLYNLGHKSGKWHAWD